MTDHTPFSISISFFNPQASLEDLLVAHRVDLALYGHHHSYQRTCQVYSHAPK